MHMLHKINKEDDLEMHTLQHEHEPVLLESFFSMNLNNFYYHAINKIKEA